jgi:hypothetical protein
MNKPMRQYEMCFMNLSCKDTGRAMLPVFQNMIPPAQSQEKPHAAFLAKHFIFVYLYVPFRWVETVFFLTRSVHRSEHV